MINGENFFDQPVKNNKVTYKNIRKIAIGKGDDYTTGCLLDYPYFKDPYFKHALDADPRANQQINFTANLDRVTQESILENILDFSKGAVKVL